MVDWNRDKMGKLCSGATGKIFSSEMTQKEIEE